MGHAIMYKGKKYPLGGGGSSGGGSDYTAGQNIEIDNYVISCSLPLSVVNGELCVTFDDGQGEV